MSRSGGLPEHEDVRWGRSATWLALIAIMQMADLGTTILDSRRGAVEAAPLSASIISQGGIARFAILKVLLVLATGVALLITSQWVGRGPSGAALHRLVLNGCRISAVAIGLAALQNAALFASN